MKISVEREGSAVFLAASEGRAGVTLRLTAGAAGALAALLERACRDEDDTSAGPIGVAGELTYQEKTA